MITSVIIDIENHNYISFCDLQNTVLNFLTSQHVSSICQTGAIGWDTETVEVTLSPHDSEQGRKLESTSSRSPWFQHQLEMKQLDIQCNLEWARSPDFSFHNTKQTYECISISGLSTSTVAGLVLSCNKFENCVAVVTWDPKLGAINAAQNHLWHRLVYTDIISEETWLTHTQSSEDDESIYSGERITLSKNHRCGHSGYFTNAFGKIHIEKQFSELSIPVDAVPRPYWKGSPLQEILKYLPSSKVLTLAGNDVPSEKATYKLPEPIDQFPDLIKTISKVQNYVLKANHAEKKWLAFQSHGYRPTTTHQIQLAAALLSPFLTNFKPEEATITSKGELKVVFSLLIPSLRFTFTGIRTVWIAEPGSSLRLTTAYPEKSRSRSFEPSPLIIGSPNSLANSWDEIVKVAQDFAQQFRPEGVRSVPRIFIPINTRTKELVKILRSKYQVETFSRSIIGGKCVLVRISKHDLGWLQSEAVASFVQIQLGYFGVLSLKDVWVD